MRKREIWRDIKDYEGLYQVSNKGRVMNCRNGKILKPMKNSSGYIYVRLSRDGFMKNYLVHRLVAMAFIPNPDNLPFINHKDEVKTNSCVENLEWCTAKYNLEYSGIIEKGLKVCNKFKKKPIEAYKEGELIGVFESQQECARQLGLSHGNIWCVLNGIKPHTKGYTFKNHV